jgi:serine protease Do
MPDDIKQIDDNKTEKKGSSRYYVEGYYDSAISMPAESDRDYSYKIGSSSALPAFPPHREARYTERIKPLKAAALLFSGLFIILIVLAVVWVFLRYDLEIKSENGTINITLTENRNEYPLFYDMFSSTPSGNELQNHADPKPGSVKLDSFAMVISQLPVDAQELTYQQIYKKCVDSIVSVYSAGSSGQIKGTGIILSPDGYILTNHHLVDNQSEIYAVLSNKKQYQAVLVGKDAVTDLAVLKIDATRLKPAEFGDSGNIQVGDEVLAIGNPINHTLMMTDGIISAINDKITLNGYKTTLLQTNAELSCGSSGGALINRCGQVIGITNMKIVSAYLSTEDIGFALPIKIAKPIVEELLVNGYIKGRPSLGILSKDVPRFASVFYDLPSGVYVEHVWENSDACNKGLMRGDIIVSVNGTQVKGSETILEIQNGLSVGDKVSLEVFRQGQYYEIEIALMDASAFN